MDINQLILYGVGFALIVFSAIAYMAHRNMHRMVRGLDKERDRTVKMEKLVSELDRDVKSLKAEIARKVEERSLQRILAETVQFIDKHAPATAESRVAIPVRR